MFLNELLRVTRKKRGLTLVSLAHYSGISYGILHRLEDGKIANPHPDILNKLSKSLEIELEELMKLSGYVADIKPSSNDEMVIEAPVYLFSEYERALNNKKSCKTLYKKNIVVDTKKSIFGLELDDHIGSQFQKKECLIFQTKKSLADQQYVLSHDQKNKTVWLYVVKQYDNMFVFETLNGRDHGRETVYTKNMSIMGHLMMRQF